MQVRIMAEKKMSPEEMLGRVDHTLLKAYASWEDIRKLCEEAIQYHTASVCVPPSYVKRIHDTYGDRLNICTVVGFPLGYSVTEAKLAETRQALKDGCSEIDMVVNIGDVKNGRFDRVEEEIRTLKESCGSHVLKVIVETCYLTKEEKIAILEKHNDEFEYKVSWGCDLQTEHERYLTEQEFKRPVFVTDYPKEIKAFYMKLNEDGRTVAAMDCLVPGIGEIIGGSQREDDLELLEKRMEELGLQKEDYQFYLDLRKYGSARHAGFGLGFERCVMYLTGMGNIRDVVPFPRTVNNCEL